MDFDLSAAQARVLGCLLEKELATPEYYPLTLNALTNACNQKSNRDPVTELTEAEVHQALRDLMGLNLAWEKRVSGSRVAKYAHKLTDTLSRSFELSKAERAILCELLLRGAQTAGELRSRASRLYAFGGMEQVQAVIQQMMERSDGPLVVELPREPGRRENRYLHTLSDASSPLPATTATADVAGPGVDPGPAGRLGALERRADEIAEELRRLRQIVENPSS